MRVTNEMLGIETRKRILYLDQNFWSMAFRSNPKNSKWNSAMQRIEGLLELQLLAVPYSSTHENETHLWTGRSGDLLNFITTTARGHKFEPYYQIERVQILKAFQSYLDNAPAQFSRDEREALAGSVHEWDGPFSVSVHAQVPPTEVKRKGGFKKQAIDELEKTLSNWKLSTNTFAQDLTLEFSDCARILVDNYAKKASRLLAGDFSALVDAPINAEIVGDMIYILKIKGCADLTSIGGFFNSKHFAEVPSLQLSARLFSAFKKRVREGMYPDPRKAREDYEGFLFDVQHASTYVPYSDAFFTDKLMADLLRDKNVAAEKTFGCRVFSAAHWPEFFRWLDQIEASMTAEHSDGLGWAYPKYRAKAA